MAVAKAAILCFSEGSLEQTLDLTPVTVLVGPACTSSKVVPALLAPHTGTGEKEHESRPDRLWPHAPAITSVANGKAEPFP